MSAFHWLAGPLFACVFVLLALWIPRTIGVLTLLAFACIVCNELVHGSASNAFGAAICGVLWTVLPFVLASIPRASSDIKKT